MESMATSFVVIAVVNKSIDLRFRLNGREDSPDKRRAASATGTYYSRTQGYELLHVRREILRRKIIDSAPAYQLG